MGTALEKLHKLRERVKRFKELSQTLKKLESPTLEKSLEGTSKNSLKSVLLWWQGLDRA
jgi:DNA-binding HxlR family transcriptional regulator